MNRKTIAAVIGAAALALGVAACQSGGSNAGQQQENRQQGQDTTTYELNQPIPHFAFSYYRQALIDVEASQALGEQTTSFFFEPGGGDPDPIDSCPSLGDPVPNTAQLSNPAQVVTPTGGSNGNTAVTIGQMDPNGVYSPSDSSGTYVLCVAADGSPELHYWEGYVYAVNGSATWDAATHSVTTYGAPVMPKCKVTVSTSSAGKKSATTTCTK
jgi:hypothetical protein